MRVHVVLNRGKNLNFDQPHRSSIAAAAPFVILDKELLSRCAQFPEARLSKRPDIFRRETKRYVRTYGASCIPSAQHFMIETF